MVYRTEEFLFKVQTLLREDRNNLDFIPTRKNKRARQRYGLSISEIEDYILNLNIKDLYSGPEKDRDRSEEYLYIFKKHLKNEMFYIKLKLRNDTIVVCLSFHKDE